MRTLGHLLLSGLRIQRRHQRGLLHHRFTQAHQRGIRRGQGTQHLKVIRQSGATVFPGTVDAVNACQKILPAAGIFSQVQATDLTGNRKLLPR